MNLRRHIKQEPIQLQLAPMIDVIMFLLCFFLLTWNLARYEQDLDVKVPVARNGVPPKQLPGEVIIQRGQGDVGQQRGAHAPNAKGNFCFEATLGYRRLERGR